MASFLRGYEVQSRGSEPCLSDGYPFAEWWRWGGAYAVPRSAAGMCGACRSSDSRRQHRCGGPTRPTGASRR